MFRDSSESVHISKVISARIPTVDSPESAMSSFFSALAPGYSRYGTKATKKESAECL